jgi:hypothetical protein
MTRLTYFTAFTLLILATAADAARFDEMDYGPVLGTTVDAHWPEGNVTEKGLCIKLKAAVPTSQSGPIGKGELEYEDADSYKRKPVELNDAYRYQRFDIGGYLVAVPAGDYDVTLQFAEIQKKKEGLRIFDVYVQEKSVSTRWTSPRLSVSRAASNCMFASSSTRSTGRASAASLSKRRTATSSRRSTAVDRLWRRTATTPAGRKMSSSPRRSAPEYCSTPTCCVIPPAGRTASSCCAARSTTIPMAHTR